MFCLCFNVVVVVVVGKHDGGCVSFLVCLASCLVAGSCKGGDHTVKPQSYLVWTHWDQLASILVWTHWDQLASILVWTHWDQLASILGQQSLSIIQA